MTDDSLEEVLGLFENTPCRLPDSVVASLLDELCTDLGYCLELQEYARLLDDPPTDPETFACQVMSVQDGWSDPDAFIQVLRPVLKTFLGVLRSGR